MNGMRVAAVGDNCLDVYAALGKAYPGGNPVNVAVYMRRLGMDASYTGVVGTDQYGSIMKKTLAARGVDISHLHTRHGKTAVTQVDLVNSERVFGDYDEGVMADFKLTEADIEFICHHDILHTGIWGKIEKSLPELHRRGVKISFDFADKLTHEIVQQSLPDVDYAFFSYSKDDAFIRDYLKSAQAKGPKVVIATLGENGSIAFDGKSFKQFGIVPVKVVDTMGAGDSFIAGFIRGLLLEKDLQQCLELGAINASETLKYMGAWEVEADTKKGIDVAAIGDNCMDVYPKLSRQYVTGNAVDFAINIKQLGFDTAIISVTGNDANGKLMQETLEKEGIDSTHLRTGNGATAITYMDMNGKDRVHGDYVEGVLETMSFSADDIDFASRHSLVHTAFWGKADSHLEQLRAHGALLSFDYATKIADPLVEKTLPYVDYAFFSFSGSDDEAKKILRNVCKAGPQVAVATFGNKGSLAYDGEQFYRFGIFPAIVENTVGAGDAFIAGFMAGILSGDVIQKCLESGAQVAAKVVETFEPWVKCK
jgi:fructoselysine 6-kinase